MCSHLRRKTQYFYIASYIEEQLTKETFRSGKKHMVLERNTKA